jgi:transketolase
MPMETMPMETGSRRGVRIDLGRETQAPPLDATALDDLETLDLLYRSLCTILYNYVPMSGHPGGSISSGRFVATLLYDAMDYDVSDPDRVDADLISYAAGHKALGLYAMWALRNEIVRVAAPELLPADERWQLRLEDLLGFRRNPTAETPLFRRLRAKALDGHPTPATPFLRLATGASGVGLASSLGLALGAADYYGGRAPRVHIVEGEGGLTPGRVYEALAFAGTTGLANAFVHVDWNQASIDSNHVTREGDVPGDYVQWTPMELFQLHDWNVVHVPDGTDLQMVVAAQRRALAIDNGQPTALVYRTRKGWRYGIEGRASHGAGHGLCSPGFATALAPLARREGVRVHVCEDPAAGCGAGTDRGVVEGCFWQALLAVRGVVERRRDLAERLAQRLAESRRRLDAAGRAPRPGAPVVGRVYAAARPAEVPAELVLVPGSTTTLRGQLGKVLGHLNRASEGALLVAAADLLGSTSVNEVTAAFPAGFHHAARNPGSRTLSVGGICEDAMSGVLAGLSTFGRHVGVGSSYGAFMAPLGHIAARLHAIGAQARKSLSGDAAHPFFLVCAHAGLKTGEDGPTHADPQPLQLLQENFPPGACITLTPWDPQEVWPLVTAALTRRPAVIAPFVTRPTERVLDRDALGLAPASAAVQGVYLLAAAGSGEGDGTVVLQESGIAYAFLEGALPRLREDGYDLNVYYVASAELFDALPEDDRTRIFPEARAQEAMGITGFTLATMYRWIRSDLGRSMTLHPYRHGHFPGSGPGDVVIAEAGLDGDSQYRTIVRYVEALRASREGRVLAGTV